LIAEAQGETAGYAKLNFGEAPIVIAAKKSVEIVRFYARKQWIGQGVGSRLMAACLDEAGMALDFSQLKKKTRILLEKLDHQNLNDIPPFNGINPSSENIALYLFNLLTEDLKDFPAVTLTQVTVWESDTSKASYTKTQTS
jgi:GNAT superfamily N-acetyltransferase